MKVQLTTSPRPSLAVIIALAHSPAATQSLLRLVHTRLQTASPSARPISVPAPTLSPSPIFDTSLLTLGASSSSNASGPYHLLVSQSGSHSLRRHDFTAIPSIPSRPPPSLILLPPSNPARRSPGRHRTPPLQSRMRTSPSQPKRFMNFTATQLRTLTPEHRTKMRPLAHPWAALIEARGERPNEGNQHFLDTTIDMRERVERPLPAQFRFCRWNYSLQISLLKRC